MQNNLSELSITDVFKLALNASTGAKTLGGEIGLVLNPYDRINDDHLTADGAVQKYQQSVADRVPLVTTFVRDLRDCRIWCFRAKDTLKPFLGDTHNDLWRPTGFVTSLRVPDDYAGMYPLLGKLAKRPTEVIDTSVISYGLDSAGEVEVRYSRRRS